MKPTNLGLILDRPLQSFLPLLSLFGKGFPLRHGDFRELSKCTRSDSGLSAAPAWAVLLNFNVQYPASESSSPGRCRALTLWGCRMFCRNTCVWSESLRGYSTGSRGALDKRKAPTPNIQRNAPGYTIPTGRLIVLHISNQHQ
jgi:hypothetical protein